MRESRGSLVLPRTLNDESTVLRWMDVFDPAGNSEPNGQAWVDVGMDRREVRAAAGCPSLGHP